MSSRNASATYKYEQGVVNNNKIKKNVCRYLHLSSQILVVGTPGAATTEMHDSIVQFRSW